MMLTLRDGDSTGFEMPASLGSLTIHFRRMTERGRSGGTESGQVSRVMSHVVLSSRGFIDRGLDWSTVRVVRKTSLLTIEAGN
jgi:hypothetical protein